MLFFVIIWFYKCLSLNFWLKWALLFVSGWKCFLWWLSRSPLKANWAWVSIGWFVRFEEEVKIKLLYKTLDKLIIYICLMAIIVIFISCLLICRGTHLFVFHLEIFKPFLLHPYFCSPPFLHWPYWSFISMNSLYKISIVNTQKDQVTKFR